MPNINISNFVLENKEINYSREGPLEVKLLGLEYKHILVKIPHCFLKTVQ